MEHLITTLMLMLAPVLFFGIGGGASKDEKLALKDMKSLAGTAGTQGQRDTLKASDWFTTLMSGDMRAIAKQMGPLISGIVTRGNQAKKTTAEFGNRGGGTNASMQVIDDRTRSAVDEMISGATTTAASQVGNLGVSLLGQGMSGQESAFTMAKTIQEQEQARWGDIFGSISSIAGSVLAPGASAASAAGKAAGGLF